MILRLRTTTIALTLMVSAFAGCVGLENGGRRAGEAVQTATLNDEFREALAAHEAGKYWLAVGLIQNIIDRVPDAERREHLSFLLADSYFELGDLHRAERGLGAYLEAYPQGRFAEQARQNLVVLQAQRAEPVLAAEERLHEAREDKAALLALEEQFPTDPRIKYRLGNVFYEIGDYETAGRYYFEAQSLEASFQEKRLVRQRLYLDEEGRPGTLTPGEVREVRRAEDPLVVFDLYPYRQRIEGGFVPNPVFANVTGKVQNESVRFVRDVVLEVRFLNRLNDILDLQYVPVGDLPPGAVRPFLAKAANYDNIYNITDVQVIAREGI